MVNFEIANCSVFRDNREKIPDAEAGDGTGGIKVICSPPGVPDDLISSNNVEGDFSELPGSEFVNCYSFSSFPENQPLM